MLRCWRPGSTGGPPARRSISPTAPTRPSRVRGLSSPSTWGSCCRPSRCRLQVAKAAAVILESAARAAGAKSAPRLNRSRLRLLYYNQRYSIEKARRELGDELCISFREGCRERRLDNVSMERSTTGPFGDHRRTEPRAIRRFRVSAGSRDEAATVSAPETPERPPESWPVRARERARRTGDWASEQCSRIHAADRSVSERERLAAAGLLAGGLAYRLFFWLVPLGLVFAAVLSFWVDVDPVALEDAAEDFGISGAATQSAMNAIEAEHHARWYFLLAGIALVIWFGIGVVRALIVVPCGRLGAEAGEAPAPAGRKPDVHGCSRRGDRPVLVDPDAAQAARRHRDPADAVAPGRLSSPRPCG